jgi:hypothetical protein
MLKPLSLSLGLVLALSIAGVSKAGGHDGCATCGIASPQGIVSPQSIIASPQCDTCAPKKHCFKMPKLPKFHCPKPTWTYEWVLKKKLCWTKNHGCDDCGPAPVYPTSQSYPSPQGYHAAPQTGYAAPAGQAAYGVGDMKPAPVLSADEVPPAPTIATGGSSLLQLTPSGR